VRESGDKIPAIKTKKCAVYIRIKILYKKKKSINNHLHAIHLQAEACSDKYSSIIEVSISDSLKDQ
jgi:hypothetical protein